MPSPSPKLTLGPCLYNWPAEQRRDFYFRMADEAPVDIVTIGEAVCSKRAPFFDPFLPEIAERLTAAGKEVVFTTLSLVMNEREAKVIAELAQTPELMIEANDVSAAALLKGRPHVIGPFVNVYNEGTVAALAKGGAVRVALPAELNREDIAVLAAGNTGIEVQVFGRLPLALSARCYAARAHGLTRDSCRYVCEEDRDGMDVDTLDGQHFLAINGTQTMSYTVCNLLAELAAMREMGVRHFRLWPQDVDMVAVAGVFRDVLEGREDVEGGAVRLGELVTFAPFSNGYYYGKEGAAEVASGHDEMDFIEQLQAENLDLPPR